MNNLYEQFLKQIEAENPELAENIKQYDPQTMELLLLAIAQKQVSENADLAGIKVDLKYKLEKFEGEVTEDSKPFEVIEGSF